MGAAIAIAAERMIEADPVFGALSHYIRSLENPVGGVTQLISRRR
jgi:hypothetical protein